MNFSLLRRGDESGQAGVPYPGSRPKSWKVSLLERKAKPLFLVIGLLIAAGLAAFVATPLLSAETAVSSSLPVDVSPLADLKRRRLVVYENLKDLEFEFQAGKIATQDYQSLKQNYLGEAAALMASSQATEQLKETDAVLEREIAARRALRRAPPPQDYVCRHCGYENPVPVKFCGECGTKIAARSRKP